MPQCQGKKQKIRTNEELKYTLANEDIPRYIKAQKLQCPGQQERMEDLRLVNSLRRKYYPAEKGGIPNQRWLEDMIKDLQAMK